MQALIGDGYTDVDFAALLELEARASGLELVSEDAPVTDGLRRRSACAATGLTVSPWQSRTRAPSARCSERYGRMLLIREFESEIHRLFLRGEVHGTTHLYAGQEAVAVGVCSRCEPGD